MKIGAQLYTVREFTQNEQDVKETLKKVAQIGYTTVQVSAVADMDPQLLYEMAEENGLEIVREIMPISARVIVNMASMKLRKAEIEEFLQDLACASQVTE